MNVMLMKGAKEAPRAARSRMDTILVTPKMIQSWVVPPFQRPLKVNAKVRAIAEELRHNGGVVDGVLTLGQIDGDKTIWLMDGQHRIEAAKLSELPEVIADVRICDFDSMAEMGEEFVKLNSAIVRLNPDDIMRGMEGTVAVIHNIREACPFVGYDSVRRSPAGPVLSMSAACRMWVGSRNEAPKGTVGSALSVVTEMAPQEADDLVKFLLIARAAWGSDPSNYRLWTGLNLTMTAWLYRRLVLEKDFTAQKKHARLNADLFKKCLMQVSASPDYVDWLAGRAMTERNRKPCYDRLKALFVSRLRSEGQKNVKMPQPSWAE